MSNAESDERPEVVLYRATHHAAAFFDLDRTLISGASAFAFGIAAWRADMYPTRRFARDALRAVAFRLSGASDEVADAARDQMLSAVEGNRQADLVALNGDIIPKLLGKVRPEAKELVELHRRAGRDTYIVSASPQEYVEPLAQALGMTGGIGTRAEVKDGIYTGTLAGPFCYGAGKVEAIQEMAEWEGYDLSRCYAYSDSASDLPMLEAVGHPIAVNPDGHLERVARQRGWPVVIFRRRTKTVMRRTTAVVAAGATAAGAFVAGVEVGRHRKR
ncbi:MAG TPA: HAD family hydrolase [Acidimicrobiales bacterium]